MRPPRYDTGDYPPPEINLTAAYTTLIGREEADTGRDIGRLQPGSLRRASMQIGRACVLAQHKPETAQSYARRARDELKPKGPTAYRIHQHRTLARLIECSDSPEVVPNLRRDVHRQSIQELGVTNQSIASYQRPIRPEVLRHYQGDVVRRSQARVLASLTRQMHPWLLATCALDHHANPPGARTDPVARAGAFGIVLVESKPATLYANTDTPSEETTTTRLHKLQVKSQCFGSCTGSGEGKMLKRLGNRDYFESTIRPQYNPDITLISACCDLKATGTSAREVHSMLMDEYEGTADDRQILTLDAVTNHILLIATGGETTGRQGAFGVDVPSPSKLG